MKRFRLERGLITASLVLGLAACTAAASPPVAPSATAPSEAEETAPPPPTNSPTVTDAPPEATDAPTATVEPTAEAGFAPRPHRAEPAPPNDFVSDSAEFVGQTGAPQLIEFFTFW